MITNFQLTFIVLDHFTVLLLFILFLDSASYVGQVCCWLPSLFREVFLVFPTPEKPRKLSVIKGCVSRSLNKLMYVRIFKMAVGMGPLSAHMRRTSIRFRNFGVVMSIPKCRGLRVWWKINTQPTN